MHQSAAIRSGLFLAVMLAPLLCGGFCWVLAQKEFQGSTTRGPSPTRSDATAVGRIANPSSAVGRIANPSYNEKAFAVSLAFQPQAPSGPTLLQPGVEEAAGDLQRRHHIFQGVRECNLCHGRGLQESDKEFQYLVRLNEFQIWSQEDKHRHAAEVIHPNAMQGNLAFHMQQVLGKERYENLLDDCRKCHDAGEPESSRVRGVSCEACHGAAEHWVEAHRREAWRLKPVAEQEQAGMINVHDPVTKANLCLSCHLGNAAEGKVVTHEMYAAGHPPLGGFEAATYSIAMPAHWTPMNSKPEEYQRHHGQLNVYAPNTHQLLLGGVSSLASYLQLIGEHATLSTTNSSWPELALYDCFACHHDLRSEGWRQMRGYGQQKPGRPPLRAWPNTLAGLALKQAGAEQALSDNITTVSKVLSARPFGEPRELAESALASVQAMNKATAEFKKQLDRSNLSPDEAKRLDRELTAQVLHAICELAVSEYQDYDSARQLLWAFDLVYQDYTTLNGDGAGDENIVRIVDDLKTSLKANLRQQQQPTRDSTSSDETLEARSGYDPRSFQAKFQQLSDRLVTSGPNAGGVELQ